jgi:signal transduction histidine kinase
MTKVREGVRSLRYVLVGTAGGGAYALLNESMDYLHGKGIVARTFVALHNVVDDVIPVVVGALIGVAIHYLRLRSRLAREARANADELRARLSHVERDQAVWVVAAATLHELKNPLHAIGLLVDELEHTLPEDADAVRDLRARLRAQMVRALVPLDGLRALAGARQRGGTDAPIVDVAELVVRDMAKVIEESGLDLRFEAGGDRSMRADPGFLRIILENLIGNSVEGLLASAARGRGHIRVRINRSGDQVALDVSDDGPGMAEAAQAALFRPLETGKSGGLGLGLSIARALARAMEGDLAPASVEGWSTTFRITLPVVPS